jgi:hypothetical protein
MVLDDDVLVVMPTFNEAENIAIAIAAVHAAAPGVRVLVVDDGSPDGTADIVRGIAAGDDRVQLLERSGARGLGPAYLDGFAWGMRRGYGFLVEMDADGSHPAAVLPRMIEVARSSEDIGGVIGSRWVAGGGTVDWPASRRLISRGGSAYARAMLGLKVRDVTAGYRVYRASALQAVDLSAVDSQGYCFQVDLTRRLVQAGLRLVEVPIVFKDREHGVSKMSRAIVVEAMWRVTVWGVQSGFGRRPVEPRSVASIPVTARSVTSPPAAPAAGGHADAHPPRVDRKATRFRGATVEATAESLEFVASTALHGESVDIRFDGHHVWSVDVSADAGRRVRLSWPAVLVPELAGGTRVTILHAATGATIAEGEVRFDDSEERTSVTDSLDRWLSVNKWGHLGVPLASQRSDARRRLLDRAHTLVDELRGLGFRPFVSSGSLLGAVRSGKFLPHDDDIDLGNLTDTQHPAALVVESERLERALAARGHTVVRHSHAHLQIVYRFDTGELDHYIDIFTAYFDPDGTFNQPFSIRGELARTDLEPFSVITLEGEEYPAPGDPAEWLELNYGPSWRVPDPGFSFEVPIATRRRFDSWFGTFNLHRDFWEARQAEARLVAVPHRDEVLAAFDAAPQDVVVVDVGAGLSDVARALRERGREAIAVDYSLLALVAQRTAGPAEYLNLNDRHRVLEFALARAADPRPICLLFDHVLEGLGREGEQNALLLMRWLLTGEGFALVAFDTNLPNDHEFDDPTSWHLPVDEFGARLREHGLTGHAVWSGTRYDDKGRLRSAAHVLVRRDAHSGQTATASEGATR